MGTVQVQLDDQGDTLQIKQKTATEVMQEAFGSVSETGQAMVERQRRNEEAAKFADVAAKGDQGQTSDKAAQIEQRRAELRAQYGQKVEAERQQGGRER